MPDIKAEQGTPQQKPRGEAKKLNEQLDRAKALERQAEGAAPDGGEAVAELAPEEEPEFAEPDEGRPEDISTGDAEEDAFLFEDPPEGEKDNGLGRSLGPIPQDVIDKMPELAAASRDPSAPPQLSVLVQLLADRLGA